ncbi:MULTISPECIES: Z1 domain-containing protein [unclassified Roseofilum]|uniref:Z1 domain-containing protein n=1 Tax=unclassified Roseofilum TaxID=2620099 RepID=UPI001B2C7CF1|nr:MULTISPECIES: Z1 domain-containing protein [unclassified Roseofilum]MBP0010039.1 hypothetical protein [Roseofilum sp. Belize Diploria]MBP0035831.1 hypothetical protein [Roseofilum sp. Belize BBD 4]
MAQINRQDGDNVLNLREYLYDEEHIAYSDFEQILETSCEIFRRSLEPNTVGSCKGLIYGHIQSGKTSVILTTMALAADNGYSNFIVMTSNLNDIYEQTLHRIKGALDSFQVFGKKEFRNGIEFSHGFPVVLVASKHQGILGRVLQRTEELNWHNQSVLIIDDEADQASLDTNINNPLRPTSRVNQAIINLRNHLQSHTYLQTTATPQSLLLQDDQSDFRPDFVEVTIPGRGYVGGNYFFDRDNFQDSEHIRTVPEIDVDGLVTRNQIPRTVKESLLVFFLGAAILRIQGNTKKHTYLLHTSFRQNDHHFAYELVVQFKNQLTNQLREVSRNSIDSISTDLRQDLQNAYDDLQQTFSSIPTFTIPTFTDVINEIARRITSTEVIEINSSTGEGVSPNPARKHILYIGGTKIGRGVTVKNLLVTYYGRDAQQPQMDTVLQHARMYGYRQNELPAIRIYLPTHLAQRFHAIHASDNAVREQCRETHEPIQAIPLPIRGMRPTRRNVLNENTVTLVTYQGGRQYFPHLPISNPEVLGNQTQELDELLSESEYPRLQNPYPVTIDDLLRILSFKFSEPNQNDSWKDHLIKMALNTLKENPQYQNRGNLVIVNRNSNLKKTETRSYRKIGAVLPGGAGAVPYGINRRFPALLMTRVNGDIDPQGGWDGVPFWIPVVRFPDGNYAFSVNES